MLTLTAGQLIDAFNLNLHLIQRHVGDLTHEQSLIQPPYHHNCLNWILGHVIHSRDSMLKLLSAELPSDNAAFERYKRGSAPLLHDGPDVIHLDAQLNALADRQARLAAALNRADEDTMTQRIDENDTIGSALFLLYFHECYHTGQIDPLRQLAGKNDVIIK